MRRRLLPTSSMSTCWVKATRRCASRTAPLLPTTRVSLLSKKHNACGLAGLWTWLSLLARAGES